MPCFHCKRFVQLSHMIIPSPFGAEITPWQGLGMVSLKMTPGESEWN